MNIINSIREAIDSSNKIYMTFNQQTYLGGDIVSGTVEMDCLVPFFARGVILKLKGFERVWWREEVQEWEGEGQNRRMVTRTIDHKDNHEFFKQIIIVYPVQGNVNPGHYSFPFAYTLPPNLPGTYFEEGHHYHAKILYKVKASVDVAYRHDLKSRARLIVNEKFDKLVAPSYAENSKSFLGGGELHCRVWLDKNAYFPGETLIAKLKANNTSVKSTRKILIKVHHDLEMHAHGRTKHVRETVYKHDYIGFEPCFYGVRYMPFGIAVGLRPSSLQGRHVKSTYYVEIECDIPGAIDLSVNLPVRILAPQWVWSAAPPQPANAPLPPNINIRPPWQPDETAPKCTACHDEFGLFNRRHHCRHCHKVFCKKCAHDEVVIPKLKYKNQVRVCKQCLPLARQGGVKYQSTKAVMAQFYQSVMPQPMMAPQQMSPQMMQQQPVMGQQPMGPPMMQQQPMSPQMMPVPMASAPQ